MKITIESTSKIVTLKQSRDVNEGIQARVWEGETERGVKVHCYITRISCAEVADAAEFERDLEEHRAPSADVQAIPLRLVI